MLRFWVANRANKTINSSSGRRHPELQLEQELDPFWFVMADTDFDPRWRGLHCNDRRPDQQRA
jgi:hypothetical protein